MIKSKGAPGDKKEDPGTAVLYRGMLVAAQSPCPHCRARVTMRTIRRCIAAMNRQNDTFRYRCSVCGRRIRTRSAVLVHHSRLFDGRIALHRGWEAYTAVHEPYVEYSVFRSKFVPEFVPRVLAHARCFVAAHPHGPLRLTDPPAPARPIVYAKSK